MEVTPCLLSGIWMNKQKMEEHAKQVATEDGSDEGLVSGGIEWGRLRGEEYELDDGANGKEDDRTAIVARRETWPVSNDRDTDIW